MTRPRSASDLASALGVELQPILISSSNRFYHRSYLNEAPDREIESNERLEFLGDAVLGLIVSEKLYRDYPALSEGHLSQLRALLVRWDALAQAAHDESTSGRTWCWAGARSFRGAGTGRRTWPGRSRR